jgi:saccharopine dehydrogenase-like NADP-dependent oxidoreductase
MANITVLGAGMVGRAMAADLAREHTVTATDVNVEAVAAAARIKDVRATRLDVTDHDALAGAIDEADLVVGAVPGFLGYRVLESVIRAGKPIVDISFCPEDATALGPLAAERGVTAVVDMGVAPGMSNFILGYHDARMRVEEFVCLVGGLPKTRPWPFEYKAPFSPVDVIELYTRPARLKDDGEIITRPAMSGLEELEFERVGILEAFETDGLRSLLTTMPHIPRMVEKTLRYPGHARLIEALKAVGFFDTKPVPFKGQEVVPLDFTSRLLIDHWKLDPDEEELTVMRVIVRGVVESQPHACVYDLYDEYDRSTGTSSMARTTGYACTAVAQLVLAGTYAEPGVSPPETVGRRPECFEFVMKYMADRGVHYRVTTT